MPGSEIFTQRLADRRLTPKSNGFATGGAEFGQARKVSETSSFSSQSSGSTESRSDSNVLRADRKPGSRSSTSGIR